MSLVRYQPWNSNKHLHNELSQFFNSNFFDNAGLNDDLHTADWVPSVDIKETKDAYILNADIPGVDPADIEIQTEDGLLTLKGKRESEKKEENDGFTRVERRFGQFYRRFKLPDSTDSENIQAKSKHGVLEIQIPKLDKQQTRKIKIDH